MWLPWGGVQRKLAAEYIEFLATLPPLDTLPRPLWRLLPPKALRHDGCKTLVLDLDETLIHTIDLNFYGQCGKVCHPQPLIALVPCTHRGKPVAPLRQDIRAKGLCMLSQTAEAGVVQLRPRHSTVMLRIWIQPCIPL